MPVESLHLVKASTQGIFYIEIPDEQVCTCLALRDMHLQANGALSEN